MAGLPESKRDVGEGHDRRPGVVNLPGQIGYCVRQWNGGEYLG